ncbi:hypothetical protein [Christiangramia forsetii]|uniref:Membrane protein n=2 Tax=Christiangramia forsetii TaxID=411153 RepID=A0LZS2_CHRFK|nr:hypothetical protein [Christiangramia forsetii]GGG46574.1 hypothetical protein GCM10011532_33090 [Christiangramia forsetii]CAL65867.1 membrane protein [Christiangramia forsetii KT0803]
MKFLVNFLKYFLIATLLYVVFVFFEIGGSYIKEAGFINGLQNTWYLIVSHFGSLVLFSSLISVILAAKKNYVSLSTSLLYSLLIFIVLGPLLYIYSNQIETKLGMNSIIIRMENILDKKFNEEELKEKRKNFSSNKEYQSIEKLNISIDSISNEISDNIKELEKVTKKVHDSSIVANFEIEDINHYNLTRKRKDSLDKEISKSTIQFLKSRITQIKYIEKKKREFEFEKYSRYLQVILLFYSLIIGVLVGNKLKNQMKVSVISIGILIMIIISYFTQMANRFYVEDSNLLGFIFYTLILIFTLTYFSWLPRKVEQS